LRIETFIGGQARRGADPGAAIDEFTRHGDERDAILRQQKADLDAALERERIASNERIAQANNETKILIEQMRIASKPVEPAEPALLGNEVTA